MDAGRTTETDALATGVGSIYEQALGLAPTTVRVVPHAALLTVLIDGTRTVFERSLLDAGESALIQRERSVLRAAVAAQLRAAVERSLGTAVSAVSGSHDPDSGTETLSFRLAATAQN